jgi:hypothetical protein
MAPVVGRNVDTAPGHEKAPEESGASSVCWGFTRAIHGPRPMAASLCASAILPMRRTPRGFVHPLRSARYAKAPFRGPSRIWRREGDSLGPSMALARWAASLCASAILPMCRTPWGFVHPLRSARCAKAPFRGPSRIWRREGDRIDLDPKPLILQQDTNQVNVLLCALSIACRRVSLLAFGPAVSTWSG